VLSRHLQPTLTSSYYPQIAALLHQREVYAAPPRAGKYLIVRGFGALLA